MRLPLHLLLLSPHLTSSSTESTYGTHQYLTNDGTLTAHGSIHTSLKPSNPGFIFHAGTGSWTPCPEGHYCPEGTTSETDLSTLICGSAAFFCPSGSVAPQLVDKGHYSAGGQDGSTRTREMLCEPGRFCKNGVRYECPAGYYGSTFGNAESLCDGKCRVGYFCESGSSYERQFPCGDPNVYCPQGSTVPIPVSQGYLSTGGGETTRESEAIVERGHYASGGIEYRCPPGYYGDSQGLSSRECSGECKEGYYCPAGSTHATQNVCGGPERFCPRGSSAPRLVLPTHYTTVIYGDECGPGLYRNTTNGPYGTHDPSLIPNDDGSVVMTEVFYPCSLCPDGKFKSVRGEAEALCADCPLIESVSSQDRTTCECFRTSGGAPFENLFFNLTTGTCQSVPVDFNPPDHVESEDSQTTRKEQFVCPKGHYCIGGERYNCPVGRFGAEEGIQSDDCSGVCEAGYFCREASISPRENECGGEHALYCPKKSSSPTRVLPGYYTDEDLPPNVKTKVTICPPGSYCMEGVRKPCREGYFGSSEGNTDEFCDGMCAPGHFCHMGSRTKLENVCGGSDRFCREGSWEPRIVAPGFYTVPGTMDLELRNKKEGFGGNKTMSRESICEPGYYCEGGVKYQCPEGTFTSEHGVASVEGCQDCEVGYYCTSHPGGPADYHKQHECGSVEVFCPSGSHKATAVRKGYYTIGGDYRNTTRRAEVKCEPGFYCSGGVKRSCRPGVYGGEFGMTDPNCEGYCPKGFYCPEHSVEPIECPGGSYSTGGAWVCTECGGGVETSTCKDDRNCCEY